jgi:hypothetical protein
VSREDPEAFLRAMLAPLSAARPGESLPGIPFSYEAVTNAFVMLGLLPEARAEEILAGYRTELEAKGFRFGVLTGELSVRPGAYGFQDAQTASRADLTEVPLAMAAGPVPLPVPGGGHTELSLTWAKLTPSGARLRFTGITPAEVRPPRLDRLSYRMVFSQDRGGQGLIDKIVSGLSVADDRGRRYRLQPEGWQSGPLPAEPPGTWPRGRRYEGEVRAEPEPEPESVVGPSGPGVTVNWLEFSAGASPPVRVNMGAAAGVPTGPAEPPWPTPAECYLAELSQVTSMSIGTGDRTVELDTAGIVAAVADALLWVGALPPGSALLSGGTVAAAEDAWRRHLKHHWLSQAAQRAQAGQPDQAGLAVALPLRHATAVIEDVVAYGDAVSVQLYGHPWVFGEYWPMIAPCFSVRAVDDTGVEHEGVPGSGGGSPEGSREFWFWPPVGPEAKRIRVTVSTMREAAWAEVEIPGRS